MAPSQQSAPPVPRELLIRDSEGKVTYLPLDRDRILLGRSSACVLCYPDDAGLSRQHMALTRIEGKWVVEDLGSKNGTLLNEVKVEGAMPVGIGDKVMAGHLTMELVVSIPEALAIEKVEFVESGEHASPSTTTVVASLDSLIGTESGQMDKTSIITTNPQMQALIRAGRELAGHRPLHELFEVIMDLTMEAVTAGRGVLMTLDGENLIARAARGAGFKISSTVRDRVLKDKSSLLVGDAQLDQALKEQKSIVQQRVRSMIAVPLQTNDRVIGLIYVDSPVMIR